MMEAVSTSETSVNFYDIARHSMPEDSHIHTHRRQNLKSHFEINYLYERSLGGNESSLRERKTVWIKERRDTTVWRI